jgi:DNA-directed RNA polymerase subunit M/transcription elongation factor TFIIS
MATPKDRYLKKSYREGLDKARAKVAAQETEGTLESGCPACGSTEVSFRRRVDVQSDYVTTLVSANEPGETYCRCRHCGIDYFTN